MKQKIKLTEEDLRRIIKESVKRILKESHTIPALDGDLTPNKYTRLKNILGVYDNDEWNAAADTERREDLESEIWQSLTTLANGNPRQNPIYFKDVKDLLFEKFHLIYAGPDEDEEAHVFFNKMDELTIYPKTFFPDQGKMRIENMHLTAAK